MSKRRNVVALMSLCACFAANGSKSEAMYSCYFPVSCKVPDGDCGLASVTKDFSASDAVQNIENGGRRSFIFPDFSVIYVREGEHPDQECSPAPCFKAVRVTFLKDIVSSVETAHGVCQIESK